MNASAPPAVPRAFQEHLLIAANDSISLTDWDGAIIPSPYGVNCKQSFRFVLDSGAARSSTVVFGSCPFSGTATSLPISEHLDFFVCEHKGQHTVRIETWPQGGPAERSSFFVARISLNRQEPLDRAFQTVLAVPEISQMPFEKMPQTNRRFCMPTCLLMVSRYLGVDTSFKTLSDLCLNQTTEVFGMWPQGIAAIQCLGLRGAVILLNNLSEVFRILSAGFPIIASLRFKEGQIPDFPFYSSKGHMVVVRGASRGELWINDPAHRESIQRRYPADEFMDVWRYGRKEVGGAVGLVLW